MITLTRGAQITDTDIVTRLRALHRPLTLACCDTDGHPTQLEVCRHCADLVGSATANVADWSVVAWPCSVARVFGNPT